MLAIALVALKRKLRVNKSQGDKGYIGDAQIDTLHKKPNKQDLIPQQKIKLTFIILLASVLILRTDQATTCLLKTKLL